MFSNIVRNTWMKIRNCIFPQCILNPLTASLYFKVITATSLA